MAANDFGFLSTQTVTMLYTDHPALIVDLAYPNRTGPITSGIPGKCVDVDHSQTGNGTKVQLWDCNGSSAQDWFPLPHNIWHSSLCLDDPGSSTANGTQLQLWDCNYSAAQTWSLPGR
jgi:hypothetical protein